MMEALGQEDIREVGDYQSNSELNIQKQDQKAVVVRARESHRNEEKYLTGLGLPFRDGTCPDVGIIAGKIKSHAEKGFDVVIFEDPKHPEVIGLVGYANGQGHVIPTETDLINLPDFKGGVVMVSQSTMFTNEFKKLSGILSEEISRFNHF